MPTTSREEMEALLAKLRREVADAGELDAGQRARIDALQAEIERGVAAADDQHADTLREQLREHIDEFQRSHPTMTLVLGRILDHLNKMGI